MFESSIFLELVVLFGSATLVATLCHALRLPTIIGFILAGVAVGPRGLALVPSLPNADNLAEIAGIFLMFTIGSEVSFQRLLAMRRDLLRLGLTQVAVCTALVAVAASVVLDVTWHKGVFFGSLVSLSSTALVMKILTDQRDLETPYGQMNLSILLFQDLAVIPMMLGVPLLAGEVTDTALTQGAGRTLALLVAVPVGLWLAARFVVPVLLDRVVRTKSREVFFFCILSFALGVAYVFHLAGLSVSLGAFAAGMLIAESPYGRQITADIVPLRDNFLGLFFASVGMLLDLSFLASHIGWVVLLGVTLCILKVLAGLAAGAVAGAPWSMALIVALMLSQIGEFSFILASRGHEFGLLSGQEHQYFLAVSVLSMVATPFLFRVAPKLALRARASWKAAASTPAGREVKSRVVATEGDARKSHGAHAIIIGFGIAGQNMAAAFDALRIPYHVIELNSEAVKAQRRRGVPIHFGDATRAEVLEHAGIGGAKLVVIAVTGARIAPSVITAVRALRPDVQILVRALYVRDAEAIVKEPLIDVVIAEIETSVELLGRALKVYGVDTEDIGRYMEQARSQLANFSRITSTLQSPMLSLPAWDAISSIKPLRIGGNFAAIGRTLADLDLRRATGTSVVSVFRRGLGSTIPTGDFVLQGGDVANLIGSPEGLANAERLLRDGSFATRS